MFRPLPDSQEKFVAKAEADLRNGGMKTRQQYEALASAFGITNKNHVKELLELAIVRVCRAISRGSGSWREKFDRIVELYNTQANLSMRTSQSIMLQQYSTPAPLAFLAGLYVGAEKKGHMVFEPSAGNGMLTIIADPKWTVVNEIDNNRRFNLESQKFQAVWKDDASMPFKTPRGIYDCVLTNPPYGKLKRSVKVDGHTINSLDHLMALIALTMMKPEGRMALFIGGHNEFDNAGRFKKHERYFFNLLFKYAKVEAIINIDGQKLYSRQGTPYPLRLILINGRKLENEPIEFAPLRAPKYTEVVSSFERLWERVTELIPGFHSTTPKNNRNMDKAEQEAIELINRLRMFGIGKELGGPYWPGAFSCQLLDTVVPDKMDYETHKAVLRIKREVGGDLVEFVRERLGYATKTELCDSLAAEQIDAVAMSIYNIENKGQGMIIGDQTGIGKGRQAAAIIRYGVHQGHKPIFITEKANLFSDLYRDLEAIGSGNLRPFIVNTRESKTDVKDENGDVIYQAPPSAEQKRIILSKEVPDEYDFVMGTYSQFNNVDAEEQEKKGFTKYPPKSDFLFSIAKGNVMILDEAHNSSGSSNTGKFLQDVVRRTKGVVFLSATFAKRPDNMPIYAVKTAMSEANMTADEMVLAITNGGVALQEIVSSQLVAEGQMIRRERSYEGITVNYITLDDKALQHGMIADRITAIMREIIDFQKVYVEPWVERLSKKLAPKGSEAEKRKGTHEVGVSNTPYFSKVFMVVNQMLFSIKASDVADKAIERLREGKKPVIAFSSTMGAFLDDMTDEDGETIVVGDEINADFTEVLRRGLNGVMRYTITESNGDKTYKTISPNEIGSVGQHEYYRIQESIRKASTGISISPIDIIVQKIQDAGYVVAEVTGRKYQVDIDTNTTRGWIRRRKRMNTNDAFRKFNNNEVDVLLINQSGSTGASAHAIPTDKVPPSEVKPRVMIVLQAELNINTEVQKRGRINRTGQIFKPEYDYMSSAIPAEKRLMMMLQRKLKSLDANTSSNQKQSKSLLDYTDFLNKYGDICVVDYLLEHEDVNEQIGDPLKLKDPEKWKNYTDAAHRVSGRIAILPVKQQQAFYDEMIDRYTNYVEFVKQAGYYDLEVEVLDLQAETLQNQTWIAGKGGKSPFSGDTYLERCMVNSLRKPFSKKEIDDMVSETLKGKTPLQYQTDLLSEFELGNEKARQREEKEIREQYAELKREAHNEPRIKKLKPGERQTMLSEIIYDIDQKLLKELEDSVKFYNLRKTYLSGVLKAFLPGRGLIYTVKDERVGEMKIPAIFLGFEIDYDRPNPFIPSGIKLRFAMADASRLMTIAASYTDHIAQIKAGAASLSEWETRDISDNWRRHTENATRPRHVQFIVTGNLLQAYGQLRGKLVSFTTLKGNQKKGIVLNMEEKELKKLQVNTLTPILRALPIIKSMTNNRQLILNDHVYLTRENYHYKLTVPASKAKGGEYFLNEALLDVLTHKTFNKSGNKMIAEIDPTDIEGVVDVLQSVFNFKVTLTADEFMLIKGNATVQYEEEAPLSSEIVSLEAKLLLMLRQPHSMNGPEETEDNNHPRITYVQ